MSDDCGMRTKMSVVEIEMEEVLGQIVIEFQEEE